MERNMGCLLMAEENRYIKPIFLCNARVEILSFVGGLNCHRAPALCWGLSTSRSGPDPALPLHPAGSQGHPLPLLALAKPLLPAHPRARLPLLLGNRHPAVWWGCGLWSKSLREPYLDIFLPGMNNSLLPLLSGWSGAICALPCPPGCGGTVSAKKQIPSQLRSFFPVDRMRNLG